MNFKESRLSYSSLKAFAKSPKHFIQYKTEPFDSASMALGRATHTWILEGQGAFDKQYAISPKLDRRTKIGKEMYAEFQDQVGDRVVITRQEFDLVRAMDKAVYENTAAQQLLEDTYREVWKERDIQGQLFGGFADAVSPNGLFALDLKTCQNASPDAFQRDAHNMDYHLQAAIYRHLFDVDRFYWICVESKSPHTVAVYVQSEQAQDAGDRRLMMLLERWRRWDGQAADYFEGVKTLDLPRWAV